ncbi:CoA-binding protein [Marivivens donghaensis]|uniref:CoA-binding protein n=1 Tax=Marivivens donghaensis TaxID=1699413 RepID=A0ABX0VWW8_9RHOB|nr:CoA-binding protein [Marivivens donghaensis]NIY72461.1 CoA-binding protein [Marivivens donghaensis]
MPQTVDDTLIRDVLGNARTIAVVGASANEERPSNFVAAFLQSRGYRIFPVNPGLAGQELLGETVYGSLADIPHDVDMIDVFRKSDAVPAIVDEALERWPDLKSVWMQIGVQNDEAADKAEARGVKVVQNRCPKVEFPRLFGSAKVSEL